MAPMRIGLNRKPGQSGTKKLLARYGNRLICVRYRYDEERKKRYKTVELIIEEVDWEASARVLGCVYFIKAGNGAVKIGMTTNLNERIKTLNAGLPFPVTLEHHFDTCNMKAVEKLFHDLFVDKRLNGEWFDLSEAILKSLKSGDFDHLVKKAESKEI